MSKTWLTIVLLLGVAVIGSNSLVLSPVLTDVAADLGTTPLVVSRAIAAYGGATALSALLLGFTIDRYGVRTVLVAGSVLLSTATFGSAMAGSWITLAVAQAVAGLAAGVMLPAIYAAATAAGGEEEGAQVLGRVLTGWSLSLVAGVPASAFIAERFGWHASYVALGLVVLVGLVGFLWLPSSAEDAPDRGRPGLSATLGAARIAGVPALLVTQFLFMTAFYGTYAFFGDHLRATLGMSASAAGLVVLAYGIGFGIASVGDRLVDRVGPARALPFALAFAVLAYATMPLATAVQAGAYAAAFVWGFANHFVLGVIVLRLSKLGGSERGSVLGLNTTVTYLGALVGPLVLGLIYASAGFGGLALGAAGCVTLALVTTAVGAKSRVGARSKASRGA